MESFIIYEIVVGGYLILSMLSFYAMTILMRELQEKTPSLVDQRWKRGLWLGSCFLLIPFFIGIIRLPFVATTEIRDFMSDK